jgi:hypothetical protein
MLRPGTDWGSVWVGMARAADGCETGACLGGGGAGASETEAAGGVVEVSLSSLDNCCSSLRRREAKSSSGKALKVDSRRCVAEKATKPRMDPTMTAMRMMMRRGTIG